MQGIHLKIFLKKYISLQVWWYSQGERAAKQGRRSTGSRAALISVEQTRFSISFRKEIHAVPSLTITARPSQLSLDFFVVHFLQNIGQ